MRESPFPLHKRSARDAHAAIRQYTARRRCGGAQVGLSPSRLREWGVEVGLPTLFFFCIFSAKIWILYVERVVRHKMRIVWKGQVKKMGQGRKRVWLCLLVIVLAAVVTGTIYYYGNTDRQNSSEGVLIQGTEVQEYAV